jgi:hypothetical protein
MSVRRGALCVLFSIHQTHTHTHTHTRARAQRAHTPAEDMSCIMNASAHLCTLRTPHPHRAVPVRIPPHPHRAVPVRIPQTRVNGDFIFNPRSFCNCEFRTCVAHSAGTNRSASLSTVCTQKQYVTLLTPPPKTENEPPTATDATNTSCTHPEAEITCAIAHLLYRRLAVASCTDRVGLVWGHPFLFQRRLSDER